MWYVCVYKKREKTGYFLFFETDKCVRIREVEKEEEVRRRSKKEVMMMRKKKKRVDNSELFMHERQ